MSNSSAFSITPQAIRHPRVNVRIRLSLRICNIILILGWSITNYSQVLPQPRQTPRKSAREAGIRRLILDEANAVALALALPEDLPITENKVTHEYICPEWFSQRTGAVGNISTRKFTYYVSHDRKFCYLERMHYQATDEGWRGLQSLTLSDSETNTAYELATNWMRAVGMDVTGLNRDFKTIIAPETSDGRGARREFGRVWWVYWAVGQEGEGSVASIRLSLPEKRLMQLRVENPKYILRDPLPPLDVASNTGKVWK